MYQNLCNGLFRTIFLQNGHLKCQICILNSGWKDLIRTKWHKVGKVQTKTFINAFWNARFWFRTLWKSIINITWTQICSKSTKEDCDDFLCHILGLESIELDGFQWTKYPLFQLWSQIVRRISSTFFEWHINSSSLRRANSHGTIILKSSYPSKLTPKNGLSRKNALL